MSPIHIGNEGFAWGGVANKGSAGDAMVDVLQVFGVGPERFAMAHKLLTSKFLFNDIMWMLYEFGDRLRYSRNGGYAGEFIALKKSINELKRWLDENQYLVRDIFNGIYYGGSARGRIALGERVNDLMLWLGQKRYLFTKLFGCIDYGETLLNDSRMELLSELKLRLNRIGALRETCNIIHHVGFTSCGINNGGYTGCGIANGFAGAGGSGGPPGGFQSPMDIVGIAGDSGSGGPPGGFQYPSAFGGIPCDIGNGALAWRSIVNGISAGADIANGSAGVGGLGGSPGEYGSGGGGPPLGGGDGSPSGGGGPGGPPGEGVGGGGGSYERVRTTVIVDESEIVCIVKARGRANRRIVRTSVKTRPGKIRHTVRFKRVNSLQGQAEM